MKPGRTAASRRPLAGALLAAGLCLGLCAGAVQAAVVLDPLYAGRFAPGQGADATFLQIDGAWHGSTVLWNDVTHTYGSGLPIGSYSWGSGLWGRADWAATQASFAGAGGPPIVQSWSGVVATINYGNTIYNTDYSSTWGAANLLPFFSADTPRSDQENWTTAFSGYIRVTDPGIYNFSVLNDDGFFFRLTGAGDSSLEIGRDYLNPRERDGFAEDLMLSEGLYAFELGQWNRLEAGVVDLRWRFGDGQAWTLVPVTNLVGAAEVPVPGTPALLIAAASAAVIAGRRRARGSATA